MDKDLNYGSFNSTTFKNSDDIDNFFKNFGFNDFVSWFNSNIKNQGPWTKDYVGNKQSYNIDKSNWKIFWNHVPLLVNKDELNLIEFLCLNSVVINETGGSFVPEVEGSGLEGHPGVSYEFDAISSKNKASYNTKYNKTAYDCFNDINFIKAHGTKPLANILRNTQNPAWKGDSFPFGFSGLSKENETSISGSYNGFLLEADFYKFRGRGYIGITFRPNYKDLAQYVVSYSGDDRTILGIKNKWKSFGTNLDVILTMSSNSDWNELFTKKNFSLPLWAVGKYLKTHPSRPLPIYPSDSPNSLHSSILNFGASINGPINGVYPKLFYERVILQLNLINSYGPNSQILAKPKEQPVEYEEFDIYALPDERDEPKSTGQVSTLTNLFEAKDKPEPIQFTLK